MPIRTLFVFLSLFFGMTSAECPFASLNLFYYTGRIDARGSAMAACSGEAEYERIGTFFDKVFDSQVSELTSAGDIELETVVCAVGDDPARRLEAGGESKAGRNLQWNWQWNSGGGCEQCFPDDDNDDRRSLMSFDDAKLELESALSEGLTHALLTTYVLENPDSCLVGQGDLTVIVTLTETSKDEAEDPNVCGHDNFCCAPKGNVHFNCLEEKNNKKDKKKWCHQEKWRCDECEGYWVDASNPPTCTSFWDTCDLENDDCCEGAVCTGNKFYSQCNAI